MFINEKRGIRSTTHSSLVFIDVGIVGGLLLHALHNFYNIRVTVSKDKINPFLIHFWILKYLVLGSRRPAFFLDECEKKLWFLNVYYVFSLG